MASRLRSSDLVIILSGKDKGKQGKIRKFTSKNKILVEGINIVKKNKKPVPNANQPGGIFEQEAAIHISNVALFNVSTGKADKVGFKFEGEKKVRYFKSNNENIK